LSLTLLSDLTRCGGRVQAAEAGDQDAAVKAWKGGSSP